VSTTRGGKIIVILYNVGVNETWVIKPGGIREHKTHNYAQYKEK
jgi:hypothetical protein